MDNSTIQRFPDGSTVLSIYTDQGEKMTYTITPNKILFAMFENLIVYTNNDGWIIESINSKELSFQHSILSLLANIKMIVFYNLDLTYRWFEKTKATALSLHNDIDFCDMTELRKISMTPIPRTESYSSLVPSRAISCSLSDDDPNLVITKSIIYRKASPENL